MAITKQITHDGSFLEDGQIQVREITRIMEDGVEIGKTYHRHVVDVGDDITNESQIVKDVATNLGFIEGSQDVIGGLEDRRRVPAPLGRRHIHSVACEDREAPTRRLRNVPRKAAQGHGLLMRGPLGFVEGNTLQRFSRPGHHRREMLQHHLRHRHGTSLEK